MAYTYAQLKGIWLTNAKGTSYASNGWASLMAAIAMAESGGDPLATNPTDNNGTQTSWGLFQISNGDHSEPSPSWSDPATQVRLAIGKLDTQGLAAWGTYDSGAYKAFLSDKTTADLTAMTGPSHVDTAATAAAASSQANCAWGFAGLNLHNIGLGPVHGPSAAGGFCVLSRSQARALIGAGLLIGGFWTSAFGLVLVLKAAGALAAMEHAGGGLAEGAGLLASLTGSPEIGVPLAAAGAGVKKHGTAGEAKAAAGRRVRASEAAKKKQARDSQAREKRNERDYDQTMARRRDSPKGPAVRDREPAPF